MAATVMIGRNVSHRRRQCRKQISTDGIWAGAVPASTAHATAAAAIEWPQKRRHRNSRFNGATLRRCTVWRFTPHAVRTRGHCCAGKHSHIHVHTHAHNIVNCTISTAMTLRTACVSMAPSLFPLWFALQYCFFYIFEVVGAIKSTYIVILASYLRALCPVVREQQRMCVGLCAVWQCVTHTHTHGNVVTRFGRPKHREKCQQMNMKCDLTIVACTMFISDTDIES